MIALSFDKIELHFSNYSSFCVENKSLPISHSFSQVTFLSARSMRAFIQSFIKQVRIINLQMAIFLLHAL